MPTVMLVVGLILLVMCFIGTFVYKEGLFLVAALFFVFVSGMGWLFTWTESAENNPLYDQVEFTKEVPEAIDVKDAFNTKEKTEYAYRGVGVGVGVGLAEVELESKEQFLKMASEGGIIYSTLQQRDKFSVAYNYLAFMDNKPGVYTYQQVIHCPPDKDRTVMGMDLTAKGKVFAFGVDFLKCKYTR